MSAINQAFSKNISSDIEAKSKSPLGSARFRWALQPNLYGRQIFLNWHR